LQTAKPSAMRQTDGFAFVLAPDRGVVGAT